MSYFDYAYSPYSIREDIKTAHRVYWRALALPGSWWTGQQRLAIAREVRNATTCEFCKHRKQALSPYSQQDDDRHQGSFFLRSPELSAVAVDAVHRIITDQNRITQAYIDANATSGLTEEQYVELAGVVVAVFSIDEFHRSLGLDYEPLPEPAEGQTDSYRPSRAVRGTGFVSMIPADGAVDAEADLWGSRAANVMRALSLVPDMVRDWYGLAAAQYLSIEAMGNLIGQDDRYINRMQMELIAGRVSSYNECFY